MHCMTCVDHSVYSGHPQIPLSLTLSLTHTLSQHEHSSEEWSLVMCVHFNLSVLEYSRLIAYYDHQRLKNSRRDSTPCRKAWMI